MSHDVRTQCSRCGTWYWAGDSHVCPPSPTDLRPVADRPGTTWRFHVVDHQTLIKRAVLEHDAEPSLIGAAS